MADQDRNATYALILRLMEKPYAYDFFPAVRGSSAPDARGGASGSPSASGRSDPVRPGGLARLRALHDRTPTSPGGAASPTA
jgi:hypothetical protein